MQSCSLSDARTVYEFFSLKERDDALFFGDVKTSLRILNMNTTTPSMIYDSDIPSLCDTSVLLSTRPR